MGDAPQAHPPSVLSEHRKNGSYNDGAVNCSGDLHASGRNKTIQREVLTMKRRVLLLTLSFLFILPALAVSAEKSVIIGFKQKPGPSEQALIHGAKGIIKRTYQLIPAMAARLPEEEIANLKKNAKIAYIEENAIYRAAVEPVPGHEYEESWGVPHILADVTHASGNKGTGVTVAVLDTGVDYAHEDLDDNYRGGYDFVFNDDDPFDDSSSSHGTHVAGIIAAEENGVGVIGVAPEVDLFAIKVLDGAGFGTEDWIIAGIDWAVQNGIEIINLSIEGPDAQGLHDACDSAYEAGVLLVAAGGGSQAGGGPVGYPAAYDSVIAVTGTDRLDMPGYFSPVGEELELAAPGVDVLSTVAGGSYALLSGTSQAAPHVTGATALYILSNTEDLSGDALVNHEDVRLMLQMDAIDLGNVGKDEVYGHGLVNAAAASFATETTLTVTRTTGAPKLDAEVARVAGIPTEVTITNYRLNKLVVDVFEGEVLRRDLSGSFHFGAGNQQEVVFGLDATGARYSVVFTPSGKRGTSARVVLRMDTQQGEE
jgi:subtilisin